ncbi:hypothetical protein J6590_008067 [Homalodisca vitripennis]|nr:hypothetical protein J6590_008067 [Homalodisca vitripennis]
MNIRPLRQAQPSPSRPFCKVETHAIKWTPTYCCQPRPNRLGRAVLVLRELAVSVPTYFFQQVQLFFDLIFNAIRDQKPIIREGAVEALRAALVVTAQRETAKQTQKPQWYKQCYDEASNGFDDTFTKEKGVNRDDRVHGSLLVLNELMRCSNAQWERSYEDLMQKLQCPVTTPPSDSVSLLPRLKSPLISTKTRQSTASHTSISSIVLANNKSNPEHMLFESSVCRSLMIEHFDDVCSETLAQRISRSTHILQTLLAILPRLAAFNKEKFVKTHLNPTMVYLLTTLRGRDRDRATAFTTIGLIAVAVEDHIKPYLPKIMEIIRASLPTKDTPSKKRTSGIEPTVFVCITLLGHAVKTLIKSDVKDLLEPMLATGLSPALTTSLRELATSIPQLKPDISEGLLRMLSQVLMNKHVRTSHIPGVSASLSSEPQEIASIVLALRTLGSFNFDGHSLLQFVRRCAEHFLNSEQQEVRLEAVRTCSRLLRLAVESSSSRHSHTVTATVSEVLGKLLVVGITDTDPEVRYWVMASLDESFDNHLAQAENLSALFVAMNDEAFEIREMALCTIGRLSSLNPAYVMPSLRKTLIQFLTELEHSGMGRNKEQSARMLDHLVVNAPRLIRNYMEPILKVLVPKLKEPEPNPGVVISVLTAIGDLAEAVTACARTRPAVSTLGAGKLARENDS